MASELTSKEMENQAKDLIKDVNDIDQCLVHGYFREYSFNKYNLNIPSSIIGYCVLYAFWVIEQFAKHDPNRIKISPDGKRIERYNDDGHHSTTYGKWIIPSTDSSYVYKYTFQIIKKRGDDSIVIGIDESNCKWTSHWYGQHASTKNYGYSSGGWKYSMMKPPEFGGESFTTGDVIAMEINLSTKRITYWKNNQRSECQFDNIATAKDLSYCIAIYVQWETEIVELVSAKKVKAPRS